MDIWVTVDVICLSILLAPKKLVSGYSTIHAGQQPEYVKPYGRSTLCPATPKRAVAMIFPPFPFLPDQRGFLDLVVKKYPHGKVSSHLHTLQPGDSLYFLGPLPGGYRWSAATANEHSRVYLIAGGSGITPTYQLARGILEDNPNANTKVQVVFGANTAQDLVLKKELDILQQRFADRLQMRYLVSEAGPSTGEADNKDVSYGARVNTSRLRQFFGARREGDEKVFVCGPPGMEKALVGGRTCGRGILEELGFQKDQVHVF
ncbi:NADH-cytochrome b5 reductase 2 [Aspergillus awamori]|uniref:NADH-cytochrome b5 reductase 2 n=1 Tax=Aspergillus awamori TaxID=105351 RepID=A0A401KWT9_ASPAW|nr:NADH-cytochrome b5 reductase 2 [Aspergillus awamori]